MSSKPAAKASIITTQDRYFLEVERFDRVGGLGRLGLISLASLDAQFLGTANSSWTQAVAGLIELGLVPESVEKKVHWLALFGKLIGNTDMHQGNLSFITRGYDVKDLAPAYDIGPMHFAPRNQQLFDRPFVPPNPTPGDQAIWLDVWHAALKFWSAAATDARISPEFRTTAQSCHVKVQSLAELAKLLPRRP